MEETPLFVDSEACDQKRGNVIPRTLLVDEKTELTLAMSNLASDKNVSSLSAIR